MESCVFICTRIWALDTHTTRALTILLCQVRMRSAATNEQIRQSNPEIRQIKPDCHVSISSLPAASMIGELVERKKERAIDFFGRLGLGLGLGLGRGLGLVRKNNRSKERAHVIRRSFLIPEQDDLNIWSK